MKSNFVLPKVSIILPIYNGQAFLLKTLNSISNQRFSNIELIAVDDGSTDDSVNCFTDWSKSQKFPIKLIKKPSNFGVWSALRDATRLAQGTYIAQIGHDDVWLPNHLSSLVDLLNDRTDVTAAFAGISYIDGSDHKITLSTFSHDNIESESRELLFARLIGGNFLCAPSSMFRRDCFDESFWGVSNERLQDYELWLNLLMVGPFAQTDEVTCLYRVHSDNLSAANMMRLHSEYEFVMTLSRILLGEKFKSFYLTMTDTLSRLGFVRKLNSCLKMVTDYCSTVAYIHAAVLENLSLIETEWSQEILAMRAQLVCSMGLYRKSLSIGKTCGAHFFTDHEGLPYLVPAHAELPSLVQSLIDGRCFLDGSEIDLEGRQSSYLYACSVNQIDNLRKYASFERALQERRVLVMNAKETDPKHMYGFALKENQQLDHKLLDQLFKFFEEDHRSFR